MKKNTDHNQEDEMRPEYDFRGGVRGKHARALRQGYTIRIKHSDGSVEERHCTMEDGAVLLDPDVLQYFPDSESVNKALRSLIALLPNERKAG